MQESVEASLVRIRTADGSVVGAGFLVDERHILTCAHVVVQALGLSDHPAEPPQGLVSLDFPFVAPRTVLTARVVLTGREQLQNSQNELIIAPLHAPGRRGTSKQLHAGGDL